MLPASRCQQIPWCFRVPCTSKKRILRIPISYSLNSENQLFRRALTDPWKFFGQFQDIKFCQNWWKKCCFWSKSTPQKFNSSPLKSYRAPKGKDLLGNHPCSGSMLNFRWVYLIKLPVKRSFGGLQNLWFPNAEIEPRLDQFPQLPVIILLGHLLVFSGCSRKTHPEKKRKKTAKGVQVGCKKKDWSWSRPEFQFRSQKNKFKAIKIGKFMFGMTVCLHLASTNGSHFLQHMGILVQHCQARSCGSTGYGPWPKHIGWSVLSWSTT